MLTDDGKRELLKKFGSPLTFGELIREYRRECNLTLAELGKRLGGVEPLYIDAIEDDRGLISIEEADSWARRLGEDPGLFVTHVIQDQVKKAGLKYTVHAIEEPENLPDLSYTFSVKCLENGSYLATCAEFPNLYLEDFTEKGALVGLIDMVCEAVYDMQRKGLKLPLPLNQLKPN